ncbi:hypothetical protein ACTJKC_01595 [Pedobacter sp. 22226]
MTTFFFENQVQQRLGCDSPAIRYSPDEKSGTATTVGFGKQYQ